MWIIIAIIAIFSVVSLLVFPKWKGFFFAGSGGFLILNLFLSMFFLSKRITKANYNIRIQIEADRTSPVLV